MHFFFQGLYQPTKFLLRKRLQIVLHLVAFVLTSATLARKSRIFAEAIEEISPKQVEAVRASGAGFFGVLIYGVIPQVFSRFLGFASYQFDSNLRHSTMIGIVGAGGIGGSLFSAFQRFDYDFVCAILLSIIALIIMAEVFSNYVRALFNDNLALLDYLRNRRATKLSQEKSAGLGAS